MTYTQFIQKAARLIFPNQAEQYAQREMAEIRIRRCLAPYHRDVLALIDEIEWSLEFTLDYQEVIGCAVCQRQREEGHRDDCALAKLKEYK